MIHLQLARKCYDNSYHIFENNFWQPDMPSIEPRTHQNLASQCTPTNIQVPFYLVEEQHDHMFRSVRANISSFMTSFQSGRDRVSDTDLGTKYEFKEEINA